MAEWGKHCSHTEFQIIYVLAPQGNESRTLLYALCRLSSFKSSEGGGEEELQRRNQTDYLSPGPTSIQASAITGSRTCGKTSVVFLRQMISPGQT